MPLETPTFILPLTNVARGIWSDGFVAGKILTRLTSIQSSGKLPNVDKEFLRLTSPVVGADGKYSLVKPHLVSGDTFQTKIYGLKDLLYPGEKENYYNPALFESHRAASLALRMKIAEEVGIAATMGSTTILTQNVTLSGSDQYSHSSGGDPIGDWETAREAIRSKTGMNPNKVIVPEAVKSKLRSNPVLLAYFYPSGKATTNLTDEQLSVILGGGNPIEMIVPKAIYNNSKSGLTDSIGDIWGNNIVFLCAPNSLEAGSAFMPTVGYKVDRQLSTGSRGTSEMPAIYRNEVAEPAPGGILLQCTREYDEVIVDAANCAYLIKDAIA